MLTHKIIIGEHKKMLNVLAFLVFVIKLNLFPLLLDTFIILCLKCTILFLVYFLESEDVICACF